MDLTMLLHAYYFLAPFNQLVVATILTNVFINIFGSRNNHRPLMYSVPICIRSVSVTATAILFFSIFVAFDDMHLSLHAISTIFLIECFSQMKVNIS